MIEYQDAKDYVVTPTLKRIQMWGPSAEVLILGTIAQESRGGKYLRQIGKSGSDISDISIGGLGIVQMEAATHTDIWENWLVYRPDRLQVIAAEFQCADRPPHEWLIYRLDYAVAMARIKYWRAPVPLPAHDDLQGLAAYWDEFYNANPDHGRPEQWIANLMAWRNGKL